MPQLYYDSKNQVRAPQDSDYCIGLIDNEYNRYMDTLYYYGHCKNNQMPIELDVKTKIINSKNVLLLKMTQLELSVGFSAADHFTEMFDNIQVAGWMKEFERKIEPEGVFLYPKQQ